MGCFLGLRWPGLFLMGWLWASTSSLASVGMLGSAPDSTSVGYDQADSLNIRYDAAQSLPLNDNDAGAHDPAPSFASSCNFFAARTTAWQPTPGRIGQFSRVETPWNRNVWQRSDIDWSLRRPDGLTNLEAARGGYAPLRSAGDGFEGVQLHHLNQRVDGGLAEVWASTHRRVNHNVPPPSWRVTNPDAAAAFRRETPAYWRWRAGQIDGQ